MSSLCWSLPHLRTSSLPQHEAPPAQHDLLQDDMGCTQREFQISDEIVANYRDVFESRISAGAKEKLPIRASGKLDAQQK